MKRLATTTGGAWGFLVLGLLFSAAIPTAEAWAQTPTASAFGIAVSTPTASSTSPLAVLPTDGSLGSNSAPSVSVAGLAGADNLFAIATGSEGSAESNSTLENVSLLSGLITADGGAAPASSGLSNGAPSSHREGAAFDHLVGDGASISRGGAPNTQIDLPGVG